MGAANIDFGIKEREIFFDRGPPRMIGLKALEKIVFGRKQIRPFSGVSDDLMQGQSINCTLCRFARRAASKA
jgi:hypothetical protein